MNNVILILFITELLFICCSYYISRGNLLSPSLISYSMLALATLCIIYNNDFWQVSYSYKTYYILLAGMLSMLVPEMLIVLARTKKGEIKGEINKEYSIIKIQKGVNFILQTIAILLVIFQIFEVMKSGGSSEIGIYAIGIAKNDKESVSIISKLAIRYSLILSIVYIYILMHNKIRCKMKIKYYISYIMPVVYAGLSMFFSGNRAGFLKLLGIMYVFLIVMQIDVSKKKKVELLSTIKKIFIWGIILLILFYSLRGITKVNSTTVQRSFDEYITYYIGSPLYLFNKFIENPYSVHSPTLYFGEMSLTSIYDMLGIEVNYLNNFVLVGGTSNFAGNEYTWFQRPYSDFGFIGMLIFTGIVYSIFNLIIYNKILMKKYSLKREIYLIIYAYFFYIIIMSFYYCQLTFALTVMNFITIFLSVWLIRIIISKKFKIIFA